MHSQRGPCSERKCETLAGLSALRSASYFSQRLLSTIFEAGSLPRLLIQRAYLLSNYQSKKLRTKEFR